MSAHSYPWQHLHGLKIVVIWRGGYDNWSQWHFPADLEHKFLLVIGILFEKWEAAFFTSHKTWLAVRLLNDFEDIPEFTWPIFSEGRTKYCLYLWTIDVDNMFFVSVIKIKKKIPGCLYAKCQATKLPTSVALRKTCLFFKVIRKMVLHVATEKLPLVKLT